MKKALRAVTLLVLMAVLAVSLAGCFEKPAVITVSPVRFGGYPSATAGGLKVTFTVAGVVGDVYVDFGDGSDFVMLPSSRTISHVFCYEGAYAVTFTTGKALGRSTVYVLNNRPIVYVPFWVEGPVVGAGEFLMFDLRYMERGCAGGGAPLRAYGVAPGQDQNYIRISAVNALGSRISIFNADRVLVNDIWIPLPQFLGCFAQWSGDTPRFPFIFPVLSALDTTTLGCEPVCPPPDDPWIPENPGPNDIEMRFILEARNQWMPEGLDSYPRREWAIYAPLHNCTLP